MKEFRMHSKGQNWIHFRSDMNSACEAFTVTFVPDGTVCYTGDYGTLCFQRNHPFTSSDKSFDLGFPNKDTNIEYFAEKVCQFGIKQEIRDWDQNRAKESIKNELFQKYHITQDELDAFDELTYWYGTAYEKDNNKTTKQKIMYWIKDEMRFDTQHEMMDFLYRFDNEFDSMLADEGWLYGEDYTSQFKWIFKCLQSVSDIIWDELRIKPIAREATQ